MRSRQTALLRSARQLGRHTAAEWAAIKQVANGHCTRCHQSCARLTKDHIVALCAGGSDAASNLRAVCRSCHSARGPATNADTIADEIRRVRDMRGESTTAFAAHFFRSPRTIEDWEQDRRHPDGLALEVLRRLRVTARGRASKARKRAQKHGLSPFLQKS